MAIDYAENLDSRFSIEDRSAWNEGIYPNYTRAFWRISNVGECDLLERILNLRPMWDSFSISLMS